MHALIRTERDPELRVKIVESTRDFADDPVGFREKYVDDNQEFATQILEAQKRLKEVKTDGEIARKISQVCSELNIDGLRGDIVTNRAARAYCSFDGRTEVTEEDVGKAGGSLSTWRT
ncbi:unnamed protein product [Durusdinium trenchii]|uniref:magnesium chelatase n=1 Tax=Durusdinium trenchii TaxID=1381693 RepID=A0ABP0I5A8_9DINO